jgi:hypothetical protein
VLKGGKSLLLLTLCDNIPILIRLLSFIMHSFKPKIERGLRLYEKVKGFEISSRGLIYCLLPFLFIQHHPNAAVKTWQSALQSCSKREDRFVLLSYLYQGGIGNYLLSLFEFFQRILLNQLLSSQFQPSWTTGSFETH